MKHLSLIASALAVLGLTACEKTLVEDIEDAGSGQVKNSLLQVRTRAGGAAGDDATVAYPVTVYVFQGLPPLSPSDGSPQAGAQLCRAAQTIGDEGQALNIALKEGTYSVYAVGGASATDYVLPSASDALTMSAIALREGKSHGDLMAAKATVTLADGEANTVTLGMERRTMLLQSVVLKKIPTAATAVSVSVSPLWQSLTVGGNYSGTDGAYSLSLEKQSDGRTWQSAAAAYLLPPSSSPASITVRITTPSGTRSYTYSTSNELEAGYKINIEGTYTEAVGVSLTGTIEGATWLGERTIRFDFDESGSSASDNINDGNGNGSGDNNDNSDNSNNSDNFPAAGDTYQGCYVLASVVATDGESAELTLLSPNEQGSQVPSTITLSDLQDTAATLGTADISDWRPMTRGEARLLQAAHTALGIADDAYYLYNDNGTVMWMQMGSGITSYPSGLVTAIIRPVVTVTINNE